MIETDLSKQYAKIAATSCNKVGISWEYFKGYQPDKKFVDNLPIKSQGQVRLNGAGGAATAGHIHIWDKIANGNECAIVLEHDAILLHKPTIDIPDNAIVALGYKIRDPEKYDHEKAGPPRTIEKRNKHGGAHAYALTPNTAKRLVESFKKNGLTRMIDDYYFLRAGKNCTDVPLMITDPICALGWLRESTIWKKAAVDNYRPILDSFTKHYNSSENMGLKG